MASLAQMPGSVTRGLAPGQAGARAPAAPLRQDELRSALGPAVLVATALTAVLAACAGAPKEPGRVSDAAAPPRSAFEVYPAAEVASLKSPHLYKGRPLCQGCHGPDLKLVSEPGALCTGCHRLGHGNHPVDVVQKASSGSLPLLAGGKVACHTCHDPHQAKSPLREPFDALCVSCHRGH